MQIALAIFGAGVLTVASPCVLPVAPILVAGLVAGEHASRWSRLRASLWFGLGFGLVFTSIGLGLTAIVQAVQPLRPVFLAAAALMLGLYGLKMIGLLDTRGRFAWMERSLSTRAGRWTRRGDPRPMLLGALFALTWTPCAGPILGGVLTYVAARPETTIAGALMLLAYAAGVVTPLVLVAAASEYVTPLLRGLGPRLGTIERATGAALVALAAFVALQIPLAGDLPLPGGATAVGEREHRIGPARPGVQRLLFFHSEHCPACRKMDALLPAIERACGSDRWTLTRIDVDRRENAETVARFDVRAVPTTTLVDAHGRETLRLVGYQPEARLRDALEREVQIACVDLRSPPDTALDAMPTCEVGRPC